MSFTPRTTIPDPLSVYYRLYTYGDGGYDRFEWITEYPQGNCTGYAYGRFQEEVAMDLHNDFYITGYNGSTHAKYWIYNTWPDQTFTSGTVNLQVGDILVWGGGTYGHVEVVEEINGTSVTTSYSVYADTYADGQQFATRTIGYPDWNTIMGTWTDNSGRTHAYTNPFIGYIRNKYVDPTPPTPGSSSIGILIPRLRKRHRRRIYAGRR